MESTIVYRGCIGITEKKMETTNVYAILLSTCSDRSDGSTAAATASSGTNTLNPRP